ncbi:unnamed protein product [Polarella glacialis]|uniref:Uncharacterized protein n=1 Tax=Polarella glacialis TaxID=89957 RepID=A0A813FMX2_POLGL|nr:unnamed protein product [Polarella glacialis]
MPSEWLQACQEVEPMLLLRTGSRRPSDLWRRAMRTTTTTTTTATRKTNKRTFRFVEESYDKTRARFELLDGQVLRSKANDRSFHVGAFEVLALAELRARLEATTAAAADATAAGGGGLTFRNITGDVRALHRDAANAGAVFQVASQFNCLEMNEPGARPEDGVTRYYNDATQGPACAVVCQAATVFRNYFVNGAGQGHGHQVDCLADVGEPVGNSRARYWRMVNGYCLPVEAGSIAKLSKRLKEDAALTEAVRSQLQIGTHWDTEVTNKEHRVCQVFASALPVAYAKSTRSADWEPFGRAVLESSLDATLAAAALLAAERRARVKVFLTAVGGGAFGNRSQWIIDAIQCALRTHQSAPLDVMLVHFGTLPRSAFDVLKAVRTRAAPPSAGEEVPSVELRKEQTTATTTAAEQIAGPSSQKWT